MADNRLGDATIVVTDSVVEPILLAEAKEHLRVTIDDDDADITRRIKGARMRIEDILSRSLIEKTLRLTLDAFPLDGCPIKIGLGPVLTIVSVKYIDVNGDEQTWLATNYQINIGTRPAFLKPVSGGFWPSTQVDTFAAVKVEYTAGFGDSGSAVDEQYKDALKLILGHSYENREEVIVGPGAFEIPQGAIEILKTLRHWNV